MKKLLFALLPLALPTLALPTRALAQDMPLHEIVKAGETWQPFKGKMPDGPACRYEAKPAEKGVRQSGSDRLIKLELARPACVAEWHGGDSLLVGDAGGKHVWTYRIEKDGTLSGGDRYCPLRVRPGETESQVSAICVDGSSRVYAAYKEGIMVFDPTGRPCGLMTLPSGVAPVTKLVFAGSELFAGAGGQTYVRKMLARN